MRHTAAQTRYRWGRREVVKQYTAPQYFITFIYISFHDDIFCRHYWCRFLIFITIDYLFLSFSYFIDTLSLRCHYFWCFIAMPTLRHYTLRHYAKPCRCRWWLRFRHDYYFSRHWLFLSFSLFSLADAAAIIIDATAPFYFLMPGWLPLLISSSPLAATLDFFADYFRFRLYFYLAIFWFSCRLLMPPPLSLPIDFPPIIIAAIFAIAIITTLFFDFSLITDAVIFFLLLTFTFRHWLFIFSET